MSGCRFVCVLLQVLHIYDSHCTQNIVMLFSQSFESQVGFTKASELK